MIGGADLFEITDANGQIRINLTRNDSCEISTCPYTVNESGEEVPILLADGDYVMFAAASRVGRTYLKKVLTNADYNEDGELLMKLSPEDTADMPADEYFFTMAYMPNKGKECYTYAEGIFNVLAAAATVRELDISIGGAVDGD